MNVIIIALVLLVLIVVLKTKATIASKKQPESRSGFESILVSLFVIHRKNVEETAAAIRTPEISREEGLQKCKDALEDLKNSFERELIAINQSRTNLRDKILPDLKKKPGSYNAMAIKYKKMYQEQIEKADAPNAINPEKLKALANRYKEQCIRYLSFREKAFSRIEKAEESLQNIEITIEDTKISYDEKRATLEDLQQDLQLMIGTISTAKFNDNIALIQSIKAETADKLHAENARIEAQNWIQSQEDSSNDIVEADFTDAFNKL